MDCIRKGQNSGTAWLSAESPALHWCPLDTQAEDQVKLKQVKTKNYIEHRSGGQVAVTPICQRRRQKFLVGKFVLQSLSSFLI